MAAQMEAQTEISNVTLRDLYLYEKLYVEPVESYKRLLPVPDSMKKEVDEAIKKAREQGLADFMRFSQRPEAEARQVFERINLQLFAFDAADVDAGALDYRALYLFGVISKEARDTAARIHRAHGRILATEGELRTYRRLTQMGAEPISERPSKTDITSIITQIEKGQRTGRDQGFDLDDPARTPLSPEGIGEILGLKNQYRQIDNDVTTGRKTHDAGMDDATILELWRMVSDKLGGDERKINYFLSEGRMRVAALRQNGAAVAQP